MLMNFVLYCIIATSYMHSLLCCALYRFKLWHCRRYVQSWCHIVYNL